MKHMVIPDCQVKPGVPLDHLIWAGRYAADKQPDKIICLGDFADMESLSSYDVGRKSYEGRSYDSDIKAARKGMELFLSGLREGQKSGVGRPPQLIMLLGNHEDRISRTIELDRKLSGTIGLTDLGYEESGWKVIPFLESVVHDGIAYSHYFTSGVMGRPVTSARALLTKRHMSAVMGHVQRRDIAYDYTADGRQITALFAGSFYQHNEGYLGPQGNKHWRGIWMLHNVKNGEFDEVPVPIKYLKDKYAHKAGSKDKEI